MTTGKDFDERYSSRPKPHRKIRNFSFISTFVSPSAICYLVGINSNLTDLSSILSL